MVSLLFLASGIVKVFYAKVTSVPQADFKQRSLQTQQRRIGACLKVVVSVWARTRIFFVGWFRFLKNSLHPSREAEWFLTVKGEQM